MPLESGKSRAAFSRNVERELASGKPQKQAVAIAYAVKRRGHSPDRFDPEAIRAEAPPRLEYHGTPENLNETETPKKAGTSRGTIRQTDGTDSPRAASRTKSAPMPEMPGDGEPAWPGGVDAFRESSADRP